MYAAVVTSFDTPPRYQEHPEPVARGRDEMVVDVLATALHPRVRSQADGSHYTSTDELPLVPGIDAVVRDPKGRIRYTVLDDTTLGAMAERTVIETDRSVVLPAGIDPVQVAAAMNPVMSSWMALRRRIDFARGQRVLVLGAFAGSQRMPILGAFARRQRVLILGAFARRQRVLILGATGNAGRMAVQVAKRFGAGQVIAAGRDSARLATLGADVTCGLDELAKAADVDVVLDYVWGEPAARAMADMLTARADRGKQLTWIQIGSVAGPTAPVPSAALRSARFQIVGSGIGSVPGRDFIKELPKMASAVADGAFDVRARAVPLAQVEQAWPATAGTSDRIVFVP